MEYLIQLLTTLTGNEDTLRLVFIGTMAGGIFIFGLGIMFLVTGAADPLRRRLGYVAGPRAARDSAGQRMAKVLEPVSPYILPQKDWERSKMTTKMVHAGYRSSSALTTFYAIKILVGIVLPGGVLAAAPFFPQASTNQVIFFTILAAFIGIMGPNMVLERLIEKRKKQLRHAFPDALDLLVVCSEAGLGLNMAIQRVAQEMNASHPMLAEELALVNAEIRAGVDRMEALRNLARRTGLEDIRGLVSLLAQSMRFGTSIAETLRIYAEEFRDKRMQRAEEQAAKVGTKMIFPLVFCLFPSFFLVAIGPAVLRMIEAFSGMNG